MVTKRLVNSHIDYKEGVVNFDKTLKLQRGFLHEDQTDTSLFAYSMHRAAYPKGTTKKGEELYNYGWEGGFTFKFGPTAVRFHENHDDYGLFNFEAKLNMIKVALETFTRELDVDVGKGKKRKPIKQRLWLNHVKSGQAGHILYSVDEIGCGRFDIGDCHRSIVVWFDNYVTTDDVYSHWSDSIYDRTNFEILCNLIPAIERCIADLHVMRADYETLISKGNIPDGS